MTVRNNVIPISLSFSDAVKNLAGTFTLVKQYGPIFGIILHWHGK